MTLAYLFPGQGSQYRGMGADLFAEFPALVQQADEQLGYSIEQLCLKDPNSQLAQTEYTQPALYTVNALSYLKKVRAGAGKPAFVAGHSLGEYNALFAAGAFDFLTGLKLVQKRGALMAQAPRGAMAAILELNREKVADLLANASFKSIELANINAADQIIISGAYSEIEACESLFAAAGARYIRLKVSAAFHSQLMRPICAEFADYLEQFEFAPLAVPVISNLTAKEYPTTNYRKYLVDQITGSVNWYEGVSRLLRKGVSRFEEIGPGTVLTKLVEKIKKNPLPLEEGTSNRDGKKKNQIVFMYSGQGSQYYQMGRELYDKNSIFKASMDKCDGITKQLIGVSIVDEIYKKNGREAFDNILVTHPALFSFGYSLTQVLMDKGVMPEAVLGYSLGEYVAATIADVLSLEDGLQLVIEQARYFSEAGRSGAMLTVLAHVSDMDKHPEQYAGATLAGINYATNFVLSGLRSELEKVQARLTERSITSLMLPVAHAFHSGLMEPMEEKFQSLFCNINTRNPQLPLFSAAENGEVREGSTQFYWNVVRKKVQFSNLIESLLKAGHYRFIDLSPTATLSAFIKRGFPAEVKHHFAVNQFGRNIQSIDRLLQEIKE